MSLPRLWLCADLGHPNAPQLAARVARALTAGPVVVWLRAPPDLPARAVLDATLALLPAVRRAGALLLVGDRLDVALAAGADGVHLPARGLRPEDARRLADDRGREGFVVSVAVHDDAGIDAAREHATALVLSPWGSVPGKGPALGAARFRALRDRAPGCFVVALGGILGADDARAARAAGADAVAVRRALLDSDTPDEACRALAGALRNA